MSMIVFDGNSILNRAFYGVKPLTTKDGLPTNAVFGFVNILQKFLSAEEGPFTYAAIAFDLREPTFRHKAYDGYKATRSGMPEDLAKQLQFAKDAAKYMGLNVLEKGGFEADDILGTLSRIAEENDEKCYIVTGDRDSFQLVTNKTTVFLASTNETKTYTPARIREEYGVEPPQLIDVKALMGDSSDNIPGVKGVGQKTAQKLIADYFNIDGVYANIENIKGSLKEKLATDKEMAYLSRQLGEICKTVPIDDDIEKYTRLAVMRSELKELFVKLEFLKLIERFGLDDDIAEEKKTEAVEYENVTATELLDAAKKDEAFVSVDENMWLYAAVGDKYYTCTLDEDILPLFENATYKVTVMSYKDMAHLLYDNYKAEFRSISDDLSLIAYVLSPNEGGITAEKLALTYLGDSSADECYVLKNLRDTLLDEIKDSPREKLYRELELPLSKVLFDMEITGFLADEEGLKRYSGELMEGINEYEQLIYGMVGHTFNINSPKQLGTVLFEEMGLKSRKKTKTGYSTDVETLEELADQCPVIPLVLGYRQLAKLKSTYADGLRECIDARDGRIHTTFKQTLTMTGRLSSVEPNLQNIPVRTEAGRELRRFFTAKDGCVLVDCDYSQIELRVLAHISGDETLIDAFNTGKDIHSITASQVFGVPEKMVTPALRKRAKAVNFGIVYGISDYSLSRDIGVTKREAAEYIDGYFKTYPKVKEYLEKTVAEATENGFVSTMFGRYRNIPELRNSKKSIVAFGERVAKNTPIQGTAADIIKYAMLGVHRALKENYPSSKLILQVHDELLVECPEEDALKVSELLRTEMENCTKLLVPLTVDVAVGKTWYDAKE